MAETTTEKQTNDKLYEPPKLMPVKSGRYFEQDYGDVKWIDGTFEPAGIRRRLWYIAESDVDIFPFFDTPTESVKLQIGDSASNAETFNLFSSVIRPAYATPMKLKPGFKMRCIDFLPEKSKYTSETTGEYPSQTVTDKLVLFHPGTGAIATMTQTYLHNRRCYFIFEDAKGRLRMVGHPLFPIKSSVNIDSGEGAQGTPGTTITIEAGNYFAAPFLLDMPLEIEGSSGMFYSPRGADALITTQVRSAGVLMDRTEHSGLNVLEDTKEHSFYYRTSNREWTDGMNNADNWKV